MGQQLSTPTSSPSYILSTYPQPPPRHSFLFDTLPSDVISFIAQYISSNGTQSPHLLSLAEASPQHQHDLLLAVGHRLAISKRTKHVPRWVAVMKNNIRHLVITHPLSMNRHILTLFTADTLKKVDIPDSPQFLTAVLQAQNVTHLKVSIRQPNSFSLLKAVLDRLNLCQLKLYCNMDGQTYKQQRCTLCHAGDDVGMLGMHCENVMRLYVQGCLNCSGKTLETLILGFRGVQDLSINGEITENLVEYMRYLDRVHLVRCQTGLSAAVKIGRRVDTIVMPATRKHALSSEDVRALQKCEGLRVLHAGLKEGAECEVEKIAKHLTCLRVDWTECWSLDGRKAPFVEHYVPKNGVICRIVSCAPMLRRLCLYEVRISMGELEEILRIVGDGLEAFGTSIDAQEEATNVRLVAVMKAVGEYNRKLLVLRILDVADWGFSEYINEVVMTKERRDEVQKEFLRLRRRAPLLDMSSIQKRIDKLRKGGMYLA